MKILVSAKRVPDPDQKIRVQADGLSIDEADLPFVINPFDAVALEEALRIRENASQTVEVLVVQIGDEANQNELRVALAMGADRAILVPCDVAVDPWNVACVLKEVVRRERPDLVLMGKQAVDDDANQAGQFLASLLEWPQATFASSIQLTDGSARVDRETDAGIETVQVVLPAVITADLRLNEPRYASLPGIMRARKKPIEQLALTDLGVAIQPRVEVLTLEATSTARNCQVVASLDELVEQLQQSEIL
jgi:electron transfer flavoprotein beta subunit